MRIVALPGLEPEHAHRVRVPGPFRHHELADDVIYIGRGIFGYPASPYANRHRVGKPCRHCAGRIHDQHEAVEMYRHDLRHNVPLVVRAARELANATVACWCPTDAECHGDVLANLVDAINRLDVHDDQALTVLVTRLFDEGQQRAVAA